MRWLIVTAANEGYMPLLRGLIESLRRVSAQPPRQIACFDLGLEPASLAWLSEQGVRTVVPGWDLPVSETLRAAQPHLRALTVRPFLPTYFAGYDFYLWIDADTWVQETFALDWYVAATQSGALAIVSENDGFFRRSPQLVEWRVGRMRTCFGDDAAARSEWAGQFNAGVFALQGRSPLWRLWAEHFRAGLAASQGELCCDQTALNHALWEERVAVHPLPAVCNWLCHLAPPAFSTDMQRFCEPFTPYRPVGILHFSGMTKTESLNILAQGRRQPIDRGSGGAVASKPLDSHRALRATEENSLRTPWKRSKNRPNSAWPMRSGWRWRCISNASSKERKSCIVES